MRWGRLWYEVVTRPSTAPWSHDTGCRLDELQRALHRIAWLAIKYHTRFGAGYGNDSYYRQLVKCFRERVDA